MELVSNQLYFREIDESGSDSLSKVALRIAPGSLVLDLGCGPGALGRHLTREKGCIFDGVESNETSGAYAIPHYRKLVLADLETEPLESHFGDQRYDYIVCADVLEHLRNPERVLAQLPALLKPSGRILLSIPNVGYAGLIGALINGDFQYRSDGLLDATHLRFFTRRSLHNWLAACELQITRIDTVAMPINQSEFAADHLEGLPPAVLRTLLGLPDALTYQFIVEAAPAGGEVRAPVIEQTKVAAFSFMAQLFYRGNHPFDGERSAVVHAEVGVDRQRLQFQIPAQSSDLLGLRLDPANRPGFMRLYDVALYDAEHNCVWRWDGSTSLEVLGANQLHFLRDGEEGGLLLVLEGDDAWFELPVTDDRLASLRRGGTLEIDVSWPQAPDSFLVIKRLLTREGQLRSIVELDAECGLQRQALDALTRENMQLDADNRRLTRLTQDMREHIQAVTLELKAMQLSARHAKNTLQQVNDSLPFRISRPFFALANRIRGKK